MVYGQGGTTGSYNSHSEGTGGYCQILAQSETEIQDYDYYEEHNSYYAFKPEWS